jgi:FkbM family methyltransferase
VLVATVRRRIPLSIKRNWGRLRGWAYWSRRRLRSSARAGGSPEALTASQSPVESITLPAGAPDCVVAENEYGIYCVPRSSLHRPVSQTILQARVWEPETLDLLRGADRDGDIVHAGTYFGDFIPALARSRGAGALVWAFEPSLENHRCAEITTMLNGLENVVLTYAGLDASSGTGLLATSNRKGLPLGGASRLIRDPSRVRWWDNEEVNLVAVDEVIGGNRRVAVIQLDVEGHEQQALAGAMLTIERCRPLIVLETSPEVDWIAANLEPLGYQADGRVDANVVMRCR